MARWNVFVSSLFFVLGFSLVFSAVGVLLQSVLALVSTSVQMWLARIGGIVIIVFGLSLLGLIRIPFLQTEKKLSVQHQFRSSSLRSFVFGAAFAVGWTPCVGAVLGAVLSLAITQPGMAFFLLLSYSLGLGIPFLVMGLFVNQAQQFIKTLGPWFRYLNYVFSSILIFLGILVFTNQLSRIANFPLAAELLLLFDVGVGSMSVGIGVAFLAGIVSFLSPCVLPLIPAFLTYLATTAVKE